MTNLLQKAFSSDLFRQQAHSVVDVLADYLEQSQSGLMETVIPYKDPEESLALWREDYRLGQGDITDFFSKTIQYSNHLHHPRYMGHQVTPPVPITAIASMLSSLLNNGMAVYEMGLVSNPLERILSELLAQKIGFDAHASGLLTSGGTLANLTALLAARAAKTDVWEDGTNERLAVMVSDEAHYCIDRAARIMGMGNEGIIKIPTNELFQIRTDLLEQYYQEATDKGLRMIAIIGSACSTSTGSYDDLEAIAAFAQKHQLWFHADGAHGGAVVFSDKYKHLVKGLNQADSVVIDWHKMLMAPALITAVIFKRNDDAFRTFQQKAQYLWANQHSKDWFNSGKRTFECTKLMMSLKVHAILKAHGEQIFTDNVEYLYNLGKQFAALIKARPNFELAIEPESNIVCFRLLHELAELNELNANIRKKLLEEGKFYIVQTTLGDKLYLRTALMNPLTTETHLTALLDEVERLGVVVNPTL